MSTIERIDVSPINRMAAGAVAAQEWAALNADALAAVGDLYLRAAVDVISGQVELRIQCTTAQSLAGAVKLVKAWAGRVDKGYRDDYLHVTGERGGLIVDAWAMRDKVCELVEIGTETVQVPDPDAPLVTVTRPKTEWRCSPILEIPTGTAATSVPADDVDAGVDAGGSPVTAPPAVAGEPESLGGGAS